MKFLVLILMLILPLSLPGETLLLDFGPTPVRSTEARMSPGHQNAAVPDSDVSWNLVEGDNADLLFGSGVAASGVSVDVGLSVAGVGSIDFSKNDVVSAPLGVEVNIGNYLGSSPVKDGIYGQLGEGAAVGLQIRGLPAGSYIIYVHGRNTNSVNETPMRFFAKAGAPSEIVSFSTQDSSIVVENSVPANRQEFLEGDNFGILKVTLGEGQALYLAAEGAGIETRGFFNTVEIIPDSN
jgi:hypothetical protein